MSSRRRIPLLRDSCIGVAWTRRLVAALALLVALQAVAGSVFATLGPLHTHSVPTTAFVVLDDLRRGPPRVDVADRAVRRHGHAHDGSVALRHHHSQGDSSVVFASDASRQATDADEGLAGAAALAACIRLVPGALAWASPALCERRLSAAVPLPRSQPPDPFERPPRRA